MAVQDAETATTGTSTIKPIKTHSAPCAAALAALSVIGRESSVKMASASGVVVLDVTCVPIVTILAKEGSTVAGQTPTLAGTILTRAGEGSNSHTNTKMAMKVGIEQHTLVKLEFRLFDKLK